MASSTREIRRRTRSVKNVSQITGAMELVSAAKMSRAVAAVQQSRRYAVVAWDMLQAVTRGMDARHHPLLSARPVKRLLLILMTSNRGLAGGFNARVCETAQRYLAERQAANPALEVAVATLGRKGRDYLASRGYRIVAEFPRAERVVTASDIMPVARLAFDDYVAEAFDEVVVCYTDFTSMLQQEPKIFELLPLTKPTTSLGSGGLSSADGESYTGGDELLGASDVDNSYLPYLFEPNPIAVFVSLVPRLLEAQLYQAVVESVASEHAARMLAMRNATDAAEDLIGDLTLTLNQLRQGGITRELAEISAGRLALGV